MKYEEMLARIMAGEDEEAIVKEFTDNLNNAIQEANVQKAKAAAEEEAKAEAAATEARKNDLANMIAAGLNEYVMVCGLENPEIATSDVRELIDSIVELVPLLKSLAIQVNTPATRKVGIAGKGKPSSEDVFAEFFKSLGI